MKLMLLILSGLFALILFVIAGFQLMRLFVLEFIEFIKEAWDSPEIRS